MVGGGGEREVNKRWVWDRKSSPRQRVVRAGGKSFRGLAVEVVVAGGSQRKERERKALLPVRLVLLTWKKEPFAVERQLPEDGSS